MEPFFAGCMRVLVNFHNAGLRIVFDLKVKIGIFISLESRKKSTPSMIPIAIGTAIAGRLD